MAAGFYHIQKYMVAPEAMPEHLTWFKWESYATWLSGVALLILLYWVGAELYLIDWRVMELAALAGHRHLGPVADAGLGGL
jgi:uncharacterized membrane protein